MQTSQQPSQPYTDDEIDLRQLVGILWRQKRLVMAASILGAAIGVGGALLSTRYVTEGLFLTPGISGAEDKRAQFNLSAADYKRYESIVYSGARLEDYLRSAAQIDTPDGQRLLKVGMLPNGLRESIKPEFALTDKDQKAFGIKADGDEQNALIGLRLRYEDKNPTNGAPLNLLGEFARDSIIRVTAEARVLENCNTFRAKEQELRNAQIQTAFAIQQEDRRVANLREIIARNPNAGATEARQVVSLEKGTERFLSPAAQLVAAEVQIAELKLGDAQRERMRVSSELKRQYYCDAYSALKQPTSGRGFLERLKEIQVNTFAAQDKSRDIVEQTWNEIDLERTQWNDAFLSNMRFVAQPEGTEIKQRKPGLALGIVLGGVLGGMLGVMTALVRGWWRGGHEDVPAGSKD